MTPIPEYSDRVDALLAAPVGRRFVAEVAGASYGRLLDALDLPFPPNMARLSSSPSKRRSRRPWTVLGRRVGFNPLHRIGLHRIERSRNDAMDAHGRAVSEARATDVAAAVRLLRTDSSRRRRVDVADAVAVLEALSHTIFGLGFWGDEKDYDILLGAGSHELRPVAEEIVWSPATSWWWDDLVRDDQRYARRGEGDGPLRGSQVTEQVADAVRRLHGEEADAWRRHGTPARVPKNASGEWWSLPIPGLTTSRSVPPMPALHLACAEDPADERTVVWSLRISATARVFEVREPSDWARLVEMAPVDVTMSRLGDWRRWTERDGPFYLPDWSVLAEHFDAVHLTVGGYIATRSVPIPVADGYSVLAGWDPDVALWLHDVTESVERVGEWKATGTNLSEPTGPAAV